MRGLFWALGVLSIIVGVFVLNLGEILKSEWFLGPEEQRLRCSTVDDDAAIRRVIGVYMSSPLDGSLRQGVTDAEQLSISSLGRPATGEIRIHLERPDGSVAWAILYEDCTVGWSGPS